MKKRKTLIFVIILIIVNLITTVTVTAQYNFGISDVSIAFADVKYGLPFQIITPIHPGIEVGATFLKKDKEKVFHSFDATLGYYYHDLITNGTYLNCKYNFQLKVKKVVGVDFYSGLGTLYSIYPGDAYHFNQNTKEYEQVINDKIYATINAGFGLSYIKPQRIQPFIHYDFNANNVWALTSFVNLTTILKAGVKINLK